jgi:hypothetical protein
MLGVSLPALIVGFTCNTALLVGVGSWLRCRKRRGWSNVAGVSHEQGARATTRCPNGAHEDEDEAACEGGVLGHRVARLKGLIKHSRFEDSDESALCPGKVTKHDIGTENGSLESTGQPCGQPMVAAASDKNIGPVDDELYAL